MTRESIGKPVLLSDLLREDGENISCRGDTGREIASIEYNSSKIRPGSLFVAVEGFSSDGHRFIEDAAARGASAVVLSAGREEEFSSLAGRNITLISSANTRRALSLFSSAFYRHPTRRMPVIGITGTNGKTSTTYMLESIFSAAGYSPGVIGTVNYRWKGREIPAPNTTPESKDLQEVIAAMAADGADVLVMEVSSHGLKLNRVDGIDFDMAVFTNLTRDHLDFHRTFEDYFDSKRMLFQNLGESRKNNRAGIINADDEYGRILLEERGRYPYPLVSLGLGRDADYRPVENSIRSDIAGIRYMLERPEEGTEIRLGVTGRFQVYNSLCALAVAHRMRVPLEAILEGLASVENIPGRFDRVPSKTGFHVIVDYAHTNDALLKLLQSVRELSPGRIITVFGCGGNRDRTKRPLMGKVAAVNSDRVIVTSDNPRGEDPGAIIRDIVADLKASNLEIIADREEAIRKAIGMAEKDDIVVIAGKGHEDYQIIGNIKSHFDDREMARKYIAAREGA